jgi:hypothetical protein
MNSQTRSAQIWQPENYPPLYEFINWLIQSSWIKTESLNASRSLALGCLSRALWRSWIGRDVLTTESEPRLSTSQSEQIIASLIAGLTPLDERPEFFSAIISNSVRLFTVGLDRVSLLFTPFLSAIRHWVNICF